MSTQYKSINIYNTHMLQRWYLNIYARILILDIIITIYIYIYVSQQLLRREILHISIHYYQILLKV